MILIYVSIQLFKISVSGHSGKIYKESQYTEISIPSGIPIPGKITRLAALLVFGMLIKLVENLVNIG